MEQSETLKKYNSLWLSISAGLKKTFNKNSKQFIHKQTIKFRKKGVVICSLLVWFMCSSKVVLSQSFTAGRIAVFIAAANSSNTTGSIAELDTITPNQAGVNHLIDGITAPNAMRFSGSATSTAYLANSDDGTLLCFTGANSTNTASNVNTLNPRGVGTFNSSGAFNLNTTYTGTSGNQTRGASTLNNSNWFIGDQGGFYSNGTSTASPSGNIRSVKSFGATVYASTASATLAAVGIISAPTGGTYTSLPGLGTGATSRQDFYMVSSGSNGNTYDVLYVLDATSATAGTVFKYSLVSGSWTANGTYTTSFGGFGLAAQKRGNGAALYVSTGTGASSANSVIRLIDAAGFNTTINITTGNNITLFTSPSGTIVKGVAFSPVAPAACTPTQLAITAVNEANPVQAITVNQAFSVTIESRNAANSPCNVIANTPISISLLTGNGALSGTLTGTMIAGTNTLTVTGILYNVLEIGISLMVDDGPGGLTAGTGSVFRSLGINEDILPQFMEGISGTNLNRIPYACRLTLSGLNPNTNYRYYNQVDTLGGSPNSNGSGNCIFTHSTGNFSKTTSPKFTASGDYDSLTTDANGNYTGWFITEPTGNVRFTADSVVNIRILLNNGAGGTTEFFRIITTGGITVKAIGSGASHATGIYSYTNGIPKNFVMLYDNTSGTGRPLTGTFLEDDNTDNTTNYATFYGANVDGIPGAWGSFLPNTLSTGLRRIEQRSLTTGAITGCPATDDNGIWPSGVNTINPNGGTSELALDLTLDDPLNSLIAIASNSGPQCEGSTVNLNSSGGVSYSWVGPGSYTSAEQNPVLSNVTHADTGAYTVTVSSANGCTASASTFVAVLASPTASAINDGPVCEGGSVQLTSSGGNAYSWSGQLGYSSGQQNPVLTVASPAMSGTYIVTVTGANLCTSTATTEVIVNPIPELLPAGSVSNSCPASAVDLTTITVTDNHSTTGTLSYYTNSADANAGTNALTLVQAQNISITGIYYVRKTTTSVPECYDVISVNISINSCTCTPPSLSESHINANCNGASNGSINLTVNSGVAPFVYAWSNGLTTEDIASLTAGTYTVTVTDAQPCSAVLIITISHPDAISLSTSPVHIICNGGNNGSISIMASGGTSPFSFSWSMGSTAQNIAGLTAGDYTVTVTDVNGCSATALVNLTEPSEIGINSSSVNVICNGGATGSISIAVTGGTPAYSFIWSNGSTQQNQSGLTASIYSVTVSDASNCTASSIISISQPALVLINPVVTTVSCFQGSNGAIALSVSGGVQPYSYSWSTGATTSGIGSLSFGTYTVTVIDQNGCSRALPVTVAQPAALDLQIQSGNLTCGGGSDGTISVTASGGIPAYAYFWSNGSTNQNLVQLGAGTYTVTVIDGQGCSATGQVVLSSPPALLLSISSTAAVCGQSNGAVSLNVAGGTPIGSNTPGLLISEYIANPPGNDSPFEWVELVATKPIDFTNTPYSVIWSNNGNATAKGWKQGLAITYGFNLTTGSVNTGDVVYVGGTSMTPTGPKLRVINTGTTGGDGGLGLPNSAGVMGNGGANADGIAVFDLPISGVDSSTIPVDALFYGSAIGSAVVSGGIDGYQLPVNDRYSGGKLQSSSFIGPDPGSGDFTKATGSFNVSANTFGVFRTWANALTFTDNSTAITLTNLPASPYSYLWSNGSTSPNLTNVAGGTYTITVTDGNGCTSTVSAIVNSPVVVLTATANNISCNGLGSAVANASGGTGPYQFLWSNGATSGSVSGLISNTYTVTATDLNGCTTSSSVVVNPPAVLNISGLISNPVCRGVASGSIALTITGGVQPYSYQWAGGNTTAGRTDLGIGTYTVTVTDANGCSGSKSFTITQPATTLLINTSKTNVRCYGLNGGMAGVSPAGGTGPYTYVWNTLPVQTTASLSGLLAGSYTCTVTDAIGCEKSIVIVITEPSDISIFQTQTNVTFPGGNNGSASVSVSGGVPGYTYAWNTTPVKSTATITGLSAGTYKCTVNDSKSCPKKVTFVITEPSAKSAISSRQPDEWNITAHPNPSFGMIRLTIVSKEEEAFSLSLTDYLGREVYNKKDYLMAGQNEFIHDWTDLAKGIYLVKISGINKRSVLRVVIQ